MNDSQMKQSLLRVFRTMSSIDFIISRELAMIIGVGAAIYAAYSIGGTSASLECVMQIVPAHERHQIPWPHTYNRLRVVIAIAFIISSLSLRSRTIVGFFTSTAALIIAGGCYSYWYYRSVDLLRELMITDFSEAQLDVPYVGGFLTATWWDMIVLGGGCVLLLWKLFLLLKVMRVKAQK